MSITKGFEKFLGDTWSEGGASGRAAIPKDIALLDYEGALKEAGIEEEKAYELQSIFLNALAVSEEAAYSLGVKDGFNLALHLLDTAPGTRKTGSQ